MTCFKVSGRKTGVRTLVPCCQSSAVLQCTEFLRENETKCGVFLCPPLLLVLNRPGIYSCMCQVLDRQ